MKTVTNAHSRLKYVLIFLALVMIAASTAVAQTLPRNDDLTQLWPEGEKRIYRFFIDDREIGSLEAEMADISREDGRPICKITEKLKLDFSEQGKGLVFGVDGELKVDGSGYFESADVEVSAYDNRERIQAEFDADAALVTVRRETGEGGTRSIPLTGKAFALDNYMLDQYEIALAAYNLTPYRNIILPVYSVQGIYAVEYEFEVIGKVRVQYGSFADSVWQVNMVRPARTSFYIDRKHRIVKMIDPDQKLSAEISVDPFAQKRAPKKSLVDHINDHMIRLPIYGLYLLITAVWLMFLGRDSYRMGWSYLLFIAGAVLYPFIYITQAPLQQAYALQVLGPAMAAGESIIVPAVIPALLTGLIQESLKLLPLLLVARFLKLRPMALISLGAFIGAGFGWIEACHIVAPLFQARALTGYTLIERVFTIMFHITMGAALGYGLARKKIWQFWLAAVGLHTLANYLIVFVQLKMLTIKGFNIIVGLYDIALLAVMVLVRRSYKSTQLSKKKAGS